MQKFKIRFPVPLDCIHDELDDNIDASLYLEDGRVYVATLYTIANIQRLMIQDDLLFFNATDMVIVKDLSKSTIRAALEELVMWDEGGRKFQISYIGTIDRQNLWDYPEGVSFDLLKDDTLD